MTVCMDVVMLRVLDSNVCGYPFKKPGILASCGMMQLTRMGDSILSSCIAPTVGGRDGSFVM